MTSDLPERWRPTELARTDLEETARAFVAASKAPATLDAYRSDWADFTAWCTAMLMRSMPADPETVCLYLAARSSTLKPSTLQRRLSSISQAHQVAGLESPCAHLLVRSTWAGIRRTLGTAQEGKAPVATGQLRAMVGSLPDTLAGVRDRCLLLVGFAGAFRRSELVALDAEDVKLTADGLVVLIRRSKTDQEGHGEKLGVPYGARAETCPVRAHKAWVRSSGIIAGPLFRPIDRHGNLGAGRLSDRTVALVVKRSVEAIGLDPSAFAGHSLRAGLATSAAAAGVEERVIAKQTRHKSMAVLRRYIRDGDLFRQNAAGEVGL